jgi:hypothetical protein
MKAVVKKRVVSRKKQTKLTKAKSISSKKAAKSRKKCTAVNSRGIAAKNAVRGRPFKKGQSGNPKGRAKGSKNKFSIVKMQQALEKAAVEAGYLSTYDYVAEQFFADNHVLTSIMKKMLADLKSIEQIAISIDPAGDRKRSLAIQQKLAERMKMKLAK